MQTSAAVSGFTVWLTGLSGAGKSTLANGLADLLERETGRRPEVLDGDEIRSHLSRDLGFSRSDRTTNVLRIGWVCELLARNGVPVIVAAISPYRDARARVRARVGRFVEVYVACPLDVCEQRDVKGLYRQARAGAITGFTGIDDPYEAPSRPDLTVRTDRESVDESARHVLQVLRARGYVRDGRQAPAAA
ncbi:MAG: adenylyl-sulfate kinase [Vicinamibacterales bacterium]